MPPRPYGARTPCKRPATTRGIIALATIAIAVAGCAFPRAQESAAPAGQRSDTPAAETTASPPSSGKSKPSKKGKQPVTIAFGGDVHFEGVLRTKLNADPATALGPIAGVLAAADVAMVNLETAITTRGTAEAKSFNFRAPATAFDALRAAGVDVVTEANNHGMDFGTVGLADTLEAIKVSGLPTVGIGNNAAEAFAPYRMTVNGQRLAFIGATQVLDSALAKKWSATDSQGGLASAYDEDRLLAAVRDARADSDTVVVYLHWGKEGATCPTPAQKSIAAKLSRAGADIVVGGHAHRLQGAGYLGDTFVGYGLGNFAFYANGGAGAQTGVLTLTVDGRHVTGYRWSPATITAGQPIPLTGAKADAALASWEKLRECTGLSAAR